MFPYKPPISPFESFSLFITIIHKNTKNFRSNCLYNPVTNPIISYYKYNVLQNVYKNKNVIHDTYRLFNVFKTVYYNWLKKFNKLCYSS